MHRLIRNILICIIIGLLFGTYLYFSYDHRPVRILISIISALTIGLLMTLVIYRRHYITTAIRRQNIRVVVVIGLLIIAALLGSEITFFLQSWLPGGSPWKPFNGGNIYVLNILIVLVTGIPMYIGEEWQGMLQAQLLNQQYRVLQLEQQQTLFELELLRAKVNPHFLYNVHNTIAGLISKDPQKAEEMVLLLSKFFRYTLNKSSATYHTVTDETDIINTYLQMQQIRYGDRFRYAIQAAPETQSLPIPSFILQPLVENAIKHGIETTAAPGSIHVTIVAGHNDLIITIADSGPPFPDTPGTGLGLQMVINKLKLLYGNDYTMELNNTPTKYVRLTLPQRN